MLLNNLLSTYAIDQINDGLANTTVTVYVNALKQFALYLGNKQIEELTPRDVKAFYGWLRTTYKPKRSDMEGQLSTASLHRYWKALRSFFKWANLELDTPRVDEAIKMPRYENQEIVPYTKSEIQRMLAACQYSQMVYREGCQPYQISQIDALRNRALIIFLLDSGIRPSELCRLKIEDLDIATGRVTIRPYHVGKTIPGSIFVSGRTLHVIKNYLEIRKEAMPDAPLFESTKGGFLTRHALGTTIHRIGLRANIPDANPYRFRHTFATEWLRNHGDMFALQKQLRHLRITTTRKYTTLVVADLQREHKGASPVSKWQL